MDFVILKINGRDVTNSSHEDTVRFFESAQEPITIQVLRMQTQCKSDQSTMPKIQTIPEATKSTFISTAVQTDLAGFVNEDYFDNYYVFEDGVDYEDEDEEDDDDDDEEEVEFDEILSNPNESHRVDNYKLGEDVYLEEVTLCKSSSTEKLGLTVSYNYAPDRENSEAAEIYISEIARDSLTARDGRLREGDQILRVNGRDIESKEQTEKVFAQTKNTVTLLVSRCLNQNSPPISPDNIPAYQNSMIEILMRHQQRQYESSGIDTISEHLENSPWSLRASTPPPVPSHNIIVPPVTASVITTSSSTCSSQNSYSSNKDTIKSQIAVPLDRKHSLTENLKESTKKLDDLSIRSKSIMLTRAVNTASDTEHIYETIPESDSEPIYSSPYESQLCFNRINEPTQPGNRSKSSKSNSSIEEKDSSSAYNTGESCNSNPLVLELHRADREHRGSTLVLCPPGNIAGPTTPTNCRTRPPDGAARSIHPATPSSQSRNQIISEDKKSSTAHHHHHHHRHCQPPQLTQQPQQLYHHHNRLSQISLPDNRDRASSMNAEIMYTNIDNLERTMILQQEIFTQALNRKNISNREGRVKNSKSRGKFRAPNLTQYHFIGSQQVRASTTLNTPEDKCDPRMEWKVKRRPDGTRYIARRSVRNRLLGNRTLEISEERAGQTTEDDTVSEIKLGRYWSKDERKRHIEHARQRKQRHQSSLQHQHCKLRQCREYNNCDQIEEDTKELLSKKLVSDTLTHTNRTDDVNCGTNGKPIGLLSVTTV